MNISVTNLDSSIDVSGLASMALGRLGSLDALLSSGVVPVYLVSPSSMDRLCTTECRGLSEEAADWLVRRLAEPGFGEERGSLEGVWRGLERFEERFSAVGCFLPGSIAAGELESPAILLCPERIKSLAGEVSQGLGVDEDALFRYGVISVLMHEYGHSLFYSITGRRSVKLYGRLQGRIVEEALAQLAAYNLGLWLLGKLPGLPVDYDAYTALMTRAACSSMPLEYRLWPALQILGLRWWLSPIVLRWWPLLPYPPRRASLVYTVLSLMHGLHLLLRRPLSSRVARPASYVLAELVLPVWCRGGRAFWSIRRYTDACLQFREACGDCLVDVLALLLLSMYGCWLGGLVCRGRGG